MRVLGWRLPVSCGTIAALAYGLTAAGHGYVLDSGELSAAAVQLGIAHPPGHPVSMLVTRAVALLPLGSLAFRAALCSSLCLGAAVALFCQAFRRGLMPLRGFESHGMARARDAFAGCATGALACAPGFWLQGVRAEVYALNVALCAAAVERLARVVVGGESTVRNLPVAALWLGLGLANHHLLTLCLIPAWLLAWLPTRSVKAGFLAMLNVALALLSYAYLPLRALAEPTPNLGSPTTLERFLWVVSARVFEKNTGGALGVRSSQRLAELWSLVIDNLGVLAVLAVFGAYVLLRERHTRRVVWLWLLLMSPPLVLRYWLGAIAGNPDAGGYVLVAFAGLVFLAVALLARVSVLVARSASWAPLAACALLVLLASPQAARGVRQSLAHSVVADELDVATRMALPARAVVLLWTPQRVFLYWGGEALDATRPDVLLVPMPFVAYPGTHERLAAVLTGPGRSRLDIPGLLRLAAERPVFTEMDVRVPDTLRPRLTPDGLLYRLVVADDGSSESVRIAAQSRLLQRLQRDANVRAEHASARELLLWQHYNDVLFLAQRGERAAARRRIQLAAELFPLPPELVGLQRALAAGGQGPIDIAPFRVRPAGRGSPAASGEQ